jgi:hypothetical protein
VLLLAVAWFYPSLGFMLGTTLLVLTLVMACIAVIQKHRKSYLRGEITYYVFMRNIALEISGILIATACAALLGNYLALVATRSIGDTLLRFAVGVFVGLLIGIAIGTLVRKFWNGFLLRQTK